MPREYRGYKQRYAAAQAVSPDKDVGDDYIINHSGLGSTYDDEGDIFRKLHTWEIDPETRSGHHIGRLQQRPMPESASELPPYDKPFRIPVEMQAHIDRLLELAKQYGLVCEVMTYLPEQEEK